MSFYLEFDESNNTVRLMFEGTVTTADLAGNAYLALRTFVASRPPCRGIADFSHVDKVEAPSEVIRGRAKLPPAMHGGLDFVIVAPADHVFGLSRMFTISAEQTRPHLRVVRSIDEAYRFLGIRKANFVRVEPG